MERWELQHYNGKHGVLPELAKKDGTLPELHLIIHFGLGTIEEELEQFKLAPDII